MTDPYPCKGHNVTQWTIEPLAGYPYTTYYCHDCGVFGEIGSAARGGLA